MRFRTSWSSSSPMAATSPGRRDGHLGRAFRFAVARSRGEFPLLISSSTAIHSPENGAFLQVIGWDATHEIFHYYERLNGTFFWADMSHHALEDATRGEGPFDSHVNGSMVMKELRPPWVHWHAPQAGINAEALAPDDHLRDEALFKNRVTAEAAGDRVVRPGIRRWNGSPRAQSGRSRWGLAARAPLSAAGRNRHHRQPGYLRDGEPSAHRRVLLRPPLSFSLNRDTLFDTLGLLPDDPSVADIAIPGRLYLACLQRYDVRRSDGNIRIAGDSHFAFLTPEPAFEDTPS